MKLSWDKLTHFNKNWKKKSKMNEFLINVVSSLTNNKLEKEHKAFPCSLLVNQRSCQGCSPVCVCLCECVAVDGQSWVCRCLHELL